MAPKYEPTESLPSSDSAVQDSASGNADKRRQQILTNILKKAAELRLHGNEAFRKAQLGQAEIKYSEAIHMLQKASLSVFLEVSLSLYPSPSLDLHCITEVCRGGVILRTHRPDASCSSSIHCMYITVARNTEIPLGSGNLLAGMRLLAPL